MTVVDRSAQSPAAPDVAPLLLKRGADPRARDKFGRSALHYAAYRNDEAMVGKLLSSGLKVDDADLDGLTPLFFALYGQCATARSGIWPLKEDILMSLAPARHEQAGVFAASLLMRRGANVNARDNLGRTPLIFFAEHQRVCGWPPDRQRVGDMLANGANINARDYHGNTALMHRAYWGDAPMVEFLLRRGADPDAQNSKGWTAIIYVADSRTGDPGAVKLLLAHGANGDAADREGKTALWYAAHRGRDEILRLLKQAWAKR